MKKIKLIMTILGLIVIAFIIPLAIPDGLVGLSEEEQEFAEYAKKAVFSKFHFAKQITYIKLGVDVQTLDSKKQCKIYDYNTFSDLWLSREYRARVTAYTVFGIPTGATWISCDETRNIR